MTKDAVNRQVFQYDLRLLLPVLFLVGIGIVMVYSASSALALKKFGSDYFFLKKQAMFSLIGIMVSLSNTRPVKALFSFNTITRSSRLKISHLTTSEEYPSASTVSVTRRWMFSNSKNPWESV